MKTFIQLIILYIIFCSVALSNSNNKKNEYVNVDIRVKQKQLKAGDIVQLSIKFKPKKGIHINAKPPITLKIDSSDVIAVINKPDIPTAGKSDYFDVTKTITQNIVLSKKLKTGNVTLKGMLTYFFCSDSEGWCRKFKHPFETKVKIIK